MIHTDSGGSKVGRVYSNSRNSFTVIQQIQGGYLIRYHGRDVIYGPFTLPDDMLFENGWRLSEPSVIGLILERYEG